MDILGIGPLELVLIMIVALLVFGPDRLPSIGAKLGKGVRELRQLSREVTQGVNTIVEPVEELRKPFTEAAQVVQQVTNTAESLRNPGLALQQAISHQLTTPSTDSTEPENTIAPAGAASSGATPSPAPLAPVAAAETIAQSERPSQPPAGEDSAETEDVIAPAALLEQQPEAAPPATPPDPALPEPPTRAAER